MSHERAGAGKGSECLACLLQALFASSLMGYSPKATWISFLETLDLPTMLSFVPAFWEEGFLEVITGLLLILNLLG